jgi:hypothetical protein
VLALVQDRALEHDDLVDDPLPLAQEASPGLDLVFRCVQRAPSREVRGHPVELLSSPDREPPMDLLLHPVRDGPENELAADVAWGRRAEELFPAFLELCVCKIFQGTEG